MRRLHATVSRPIARYCILVALFLGAADYFYARAFFPPINPNQAGTTSLADRVAWYKLHVSDYNLLFLGDSKTYCGIHPELLDPLLHTSSLNLAIFAHWFPTQLRLVQDIAPSIPKGTTVVWSIGAVNFHQSTGVQRIYPVGLGNALRYLAWGLSSAGLADNVLYFNPASYFLTRRGDIRHGFVDFLRRPLETSIFGVAQAKAQEAESITISDEEVRRLRETYLRNPDVADVAIVKDEGKSTSLTIFFRRGSYYRVELDAAYFRRKQREFTSLSFVPQTDPAMWRIFEEILRTFKDNNINVIVNDMEDAPFNYHGNQAAFRKFMRDTVQKKAAEFGFPYVYVDFDKLGDEDYFDYNHLNSRGAKTFIPMLADQLRPYLQNRKLSSPPQAALNR